MPQTPRATDLQRTIRRLRRGLEDARSCMMGVAAKLDFTNVGQSKWRLIKCADRCAKAWREAAQ